VAGISCFHPKGRETSPLSPEPEGDEGLGGQGGEELCSLEEKKPRGSHRTGRTTAKGPAREGIGQGEKEDPSPWGTPLEGIFGER